jgi:hypothetical protein
MASNNRRPAALAGTKPFAFVVEYAGVFYHR